LDYAGFLSTRVSCVAKDEIAVMYIGNVAGYVSSHHLHAFGSCGASSRVLCAEQFSESERWTIPSTFLAWTSLMD
jgi:hypothetical protein